MSQPYIGEIKMFAGNFAPAGWALCQGQVLPINDETETLFILIGTTYGGDGQTNFALPDLRSRFPLHPGNGFVQGETGGAETVTLSINQIPAHSHAPRAHSASGNSVNPAGNYWAAQPAFLPYAPAASQNANMKVGAISSSGGNQPHENMIPYLGLNYIIAMAGVFPPQN